MNLFRPLSINIGIRAEQIVGAHLKYMAFINERPVACLGWGSAAWRVKSRDDFIGWDKQTKDVHLNFVANNTRFLILS